MKYYKLLVIALLLITASCSTQRLVINNKYLDKVDEEPTYSKWNHFVFWGVGQKYSTNSNKVCSDRGQTLVKVEFVKSFTNIIPSFLTLGIYDPRTVRVYCVTK